MYFKSFIAVGLSLLLCRGLAQAQQCPPDCPVKGGGAAATDCLLEFGGVSPTTPGTRIVECRDGDPSCDKDPAPGVCGFEVTACLNNSDPDLPQCTVSGVDRVDVRGGGTAGKMLEQDLIAMLPTSSNTCTEPVLFHVPVHASGYDDDDPPLGERRFSLSMSSTFGINGLALANFGGYIDFSAGKVDPKTGFALVDVAGSSEYLEAFIGFGGLALCLKPVTPVSVAGIIACGKRKPGGKAVRFTASGASGSDRDGILFRCNAEVNYTTQLAIDANLGVIGVDGFTGEDCDALGGTVNENGVCVSGFIAGQINELSSDSGEMFMAPFGGLAGFPVEISQESALPCGDEEPSGGMSTPIVLTTQRSQGAVFDANGTPGLTLAFDVFGEPFSCESFSQENGPGILAFAAPQIGLPILGDGVTQFRFVDK